MDNESTFENYSHEPLPPSLEFVPFDDGECDILEHTYHHSLLLTGKKEFSINPSNKIDCCWDTRNILDNSEMSQDFKGNLVDGSDFFNNEEKADMEEFALKFPGKDVIIQTEDAERIDAQSRSDFEMNFEAEAFEEVTTKEGISSDCEFMPYFSERGEKKSSETCSDTLFLLDYNERGSLLSPRSNEKIWAEKMGDENLNAKQRIALYLDISGKSFEDSDSVESVKSDDSSLDEENDLNPMDRVMYSGLCDDKADILAKQQEEDYLDLRNYDHETSSSFQSSPVITSKKERLEPTNHQKLSSKDSFIAEEMSPFKETAHISGDNFTEINVDKVFSDASDVDDPASGETIQVSEIDGLKSEVTCSSSAIAASVIVSALVKDRCLQMVGNSTSQSDHYNGGIVTGEMTQASSGNGGDKMEMVLDDISEDDKVDRGITSIEAINTIQCVERSDFFATVFTSNLLSPTSSRLSNVDQDVHNYPNSSSDVKNKPELGMNNIYTNTRKNQHLVMDSDSPPLVKQSTMSCDSKPDSSSTISSMGSLVSSATSFGIENRVINNSMNELMKQLDEVNINGNCLIEEQESTNEICQWREELDIYEGSKSLTSPSAAVVGASTLNVPLIPPPSASKLNKWGRVWLDDCIPPGMGSSSQNVVLSQDDWVANFAMPLTEDNDFEIKFDSAPGDDMNKGSNSAQHLYMKGNEGERLTGNVNTDIKLSNSFIPVTPFTKRTEEAAKKNGSLIHTSLISHSNSLGCASLDLLHESNLQHKEKHSYEVFSTISEPEYIIGMCKVETDVRSESGMSLPGILSKDSSDSRDGAKKKWNALKQQQQHRVPRNSIFDNLLVKQEKSTPGVFRSKLGRSFLKVGKTSGSNCTTAGECDIKLVDNEKLPLLDSSESNIHIIMPNSPSISDNLIEVWASSTDKNEQKLEGDNSFPNNIKKYIDGDNCNCEANAKYHGTQIHTSPVSESSGKSNIFIDSSHVMSHFHMEHACDPVLLSKKKEPKNGEYHSGYNHLENTRPIYKDEPINQAKSNNKLQLNHLDSSLSGEFIKRNPLLGIIEKNDASDSPRDKGTMREINTQSNRDGSQFSFKKAKRSKYPQGLYYNPPNQVPCPFETAVWNIPSIVVTFLSFLGDPAAVSRIKSTNKFCNRIIRENEHVIMRDAARLGGLSEHLRPSFWMWITLEKIKLYEENHLRETMSLAGGERDAVEPHGFYSETELNNHNNPPVTYIPIDDFEVLVKYGVDSKWHGLIIRDVKRSFGSPPPHKLESRIERDSIIRAMVRILRRRSTGGKYMDSALNTEDAETENQTHPVSPKCRQPQKTKRDPQSSQPSVQPSKVGDLGSAAEDRHLTEENDTDEGQSICNTTSNDNSTKNQLSNGELALSGNYLTDQVKAEMQSMLGNILCALATSHPGIGYCQGMDYIVAHLLRLLSETIKKRHELGTLPKAIRSSSEKNESDESVKESFVVEEGVFRVMDTFLITYNLEHMYWPQLRCLKTCCRVFEHLIKIKLPVLADHFEHHDFNVGLFALSWFQTLYLYLPSMPSLTVSRMWDIWLVERSFKIFFRVGTAILFLCQPILLNHEMEGMMTYLNTFPDSTILNPDILIPCALQIKVTNKLLMKLERECADGIE